MGRMSYELCCKSFQKRIYKTLIKSFEAVKLSWNINKTPAAGAAGGHVFQKGLNWHKIANFHSCEGVIRLKNLFVSALWKSICSAVCNCFLKSESGEQSKES